MAVVRCVVLHDFVRHPALDGCEEAVDLPDGLLHDGPVILEVLHHQLTPEDYRLRQA